MKIAIILASITTSIMAIIASAIICILVYIYGWGLTPQSWKWIIGGVVFQIIVIIFSAIIGEIIKKFLED